MYAKNNFNKDFQKDLKEANELEQKLASTLKTWGNCKEAICSSTIVEGSFSGWDVKAIAKDDSEITFELKNDKKAILTGNVCIEFGRVVNGEWRDTCLNATQADYWVQYFTDTFYSIPTVTLRKVLKTSKSVRTVSGGDHERARCYLLPVSTFKKYAEVIA